VWVGRSLRRLEDPRLLRGAGEFTDDVVMAGQAYAAFVRSPYASAAVKDIAVGKGQRRPGVVAVLTGAEYLADGCRGIRHAPVPADAVEWHQPAFRNALDEPHLPLAVDHVRYVGEAVAMVIAETPAIARETVELVDVEYRVERAAQATAVEATFGDAEQTEQALARSAVVVEHTTNSQRVANAQLEPRAVLASYDAETDAYLMVAGSQGVVRQRAALAAALDVPLERVRVISPDVGGGFGPRTSLYPEQVAVAWAARKVGRPVRWTATRTESFLSDFQGRGSVARARLGLDGTGRIGALAVEFHFDVGGRTVSYVPLSNAARILTGVYDIPIAAARVKGVLCPRVPTGPYRGGGRPETIFAIERLLDVAATRVGIDRIELRRRNVVRRTPYRTAMGLTFDSGDFAGNMEAALNRAEWSTIGARKAAARTRGQLVGIGLANYVEAPVGAPHERVVVHVLPQGTVEVTVGTQSTGQGHATAFAQVLADELDVEPSCVRFVSGDTERVRTGGGTHSDRSMRLIGTLLVEAAAQIRTAAESLRRPLFESADIVELQAEATFSGRLPAHPTGAAVVEVAGDQETGELAVSRYTTVDDVGQPINPAIVHGQTQGGIVQGLGQALVETMVFEPESGQVLTASFADYALPRARDVPNFDVALVEDPTAGNPLRVKGGGESGITPALACVVNAAVDALAPLGVDDLEMPLTAARIWEVMRQTIV